MYYLEFQRVRRIGTWFAAVITTLTVLLIVGIRTAAGEAHVHHADVPMEAIFGIAGFAALGLATALTGSFNRETTYAHFTFVLPLDRVRMALQIVAVDVLGIVAAWLLACALGSIAAFSVHGFPSPVRWTGDELEVAILGCGTAVAWYAILQAATAWAPSRAGQYGGLMAALLGFALPLSRADFLGPVATFFRWLLVVDPLAYFTAVSVNDAGAATVAGLVGFSVVARTAAVWVLGAAGVAVATLLWRRVEV